MAAPTTNSEFSGAFLPPTPVVDAEAGLEPVPLRFAGSVLYYCQSFVGKSKATMGFDSSKPGPGAADFGPVEGI